MLVNVSRKFALCTIIDIETNFISQMADVSPSSKKVDDFLSTLSDLSRERLKDDQKRQRDLQRDIDELRLQSSSNSPRYPSKGPSASEPNSFYGIKELSFNRSARANFHEKWKDVAPEMPPRPKEEAAPRLPTRPKPEIAPKLPQRPSTVVTNERVNVEIINPVSRKEVPKPAPKPTNYIARRSEITSVDISGLKKTPVSFSQLEQKILNKADSKTVEQVKPIKPGKPNPLSGQVKLAEKEVPKKPEKPNPFGKPLKPTELKQQEFKRSTGTIEYDKVSAVSVEKTAPAVPSKPTLRSYQDNDLLELRAQILRLSPSKVTPIPKEVQARKVSYGYAEALSTKLAPPKPAKKLVASEPEALSALGKLKPAKPTPLGTNEKPEALRRLDAMRNSSLNSKSALGSTEPPKSTSLPREVPNFHAKLSNILRASTDPSLAIQPTLELKRTQSEPNAKPGAEKLTHPNKTRSKGPKRRLPKNAANNLQTKSRPVAAKVAPVSEIAPIEFKPRKIPPPIRGKKPVVEVKPRRIVSGELFL